MRSALDSFFFFCGCYSPWWTLAPFKIARHWSRSCDFRLQFLKPSVFRVSSTEPSHLTAGLPTRRVPSGSAPLLQYLETAHSGFPLRESLISLGHFLGVSIRLQSLKASQQLSLFTGLGCNPHTIQPSWRTWVFLFVCIFAFNLSGMGDPTSSYATAGIALRVTWPRNPHH
jgi:hypothetical protein